MTLMREETKAAPEVVARQLAANRAPLEELGARLRSRPPRHMLTLARGSSDHAAGYFARLAMRYSGRPCASLPLSLTTLEKTAWQLDGALALGISQSGRSHDLIESLAAVRRGGAQTYALVNDPDAPLAGEADEVLALHAGVEQSVAATKSFIATLAAGASLVAAWHRDRALLEALEHLPEALSRALELDWLSGIERLAGADRLLVIGRGDGLPVALEAALKFKETCALQAEAFSGAEVQHGPMTLVGPGYPVLIFATEGPGQQGLVELAETFRERGACVLLAADEGVAGRDLTIARAPHPALAPICAIQSFYLMVEALSRATHNDPDQPRFLQKVTRTR